MPVGLVSRVVSQWVLHEYRMHAVDRTYWVDRSTARVYAPVGGHDAGGGGGGLGPVLVGRFLEGAVRVLSDESSYQLLSRALRKPEGAAADAETVLEKKYNRYARTARHRAPPRRRRRRRR